MTDMEFAVLQRIANACEGIRTELIIMVCIAVVVLTFKIILALSEK